MSSTEITFENVELPDDEVGVIVNPSSGEHMLISGIGVRTTSRDPMPLREKYNGWLLITASDVFEIVGPRMPEGLVTDVAARVFSLIPGRRNVEMQFKRVAQSWEQQRDKLCSILPEGSAGRPTNKDTLTILFDRLANDKQANAMQEW